MKPYPEVKEATEEGVGIPNPDMGEARLPRQGPS